MIGSLVTRLAPRLFSLLPSEDGQVESLCQQYIDRYPGDSHIEMEPNGELAYLGQVVLQCEVVFDVGVNQGDWASLLLGLNASIVIHCFEPSYTTFQILIQQKFPPNVVMNAFGLSSVPAEQPLFIFADGSGIIRSISAEGWKPVTVTESIALDTVDDYCYKHKIDRIDLLKIDIEGHELEVLRGASAMLQAHRIDLIQFEYGGTSIDAGDSAQIFF